VLEDKAREIPMRQVQAEMDAGYGIYAGGRAAWALLRFDAAGRAVGQPRAVAPEQQGRWLGDGHSAGSCACPMSTRPSW
jgi:hypothetical protein